MLTIKMQGTVFRIFSSMRVFMFTYKPERLGNFSVSRTNFVRELISLSERHTFAKRQAWNGDNEVSFGTFYSL